MPKKEIRADARKLICFLGLAQITKKRRNSSSGGPAWDAKLVCAVIPIFVGYKRSVGEAKTINFRSDVMFHVQSWESTRRA